MNRGIAAVVLLVASSAYAQPTDNENPLVGPPPPPPPQQPEPPPPPPPQPVIVAPPPPPAVVLPSTDPLSSPGFTTMIRYDGTTKIGAEIAHPFLHSTVGLPTTAYHLDLHAEYVSSEGMGGYIQIPVGLFHVDERKPDVDADTGFGIGNVEIGGIIALKRFNDRPDTGLVLHAGIMAPTANEPDTDPLDTADGSQANIAGFTARIVDYYAAIPRGLSIRVGVSPMWRQGKLFARADLGFDFNIDYENGDKFAKNREKPIIHFNAGFGYDAGQWQIMGESTNIFFVTDAEGHPITVDMVALAARFKLGDKQPYVALQFPIDDEASNFVDAALTVGIDFFPK